MQPQPSPVNNRSGKSFTLIELLVVVGVMALLVATQLPAMCRAKTPAQLLRCLSNCRQLGYATSLYRADYEDAFPYGIRITSGWQVNEPEGWPLQVLSYLGGTTNVQPKVFLCPCEKTVAADWPYQLHYQANRMLVSDVYYTDTAIRGAQVRTPAIYWLLLEKGPADFGSAKPGNLGNPVLQTWNIPPGWQQYRRHSGGTAATAADGHTEWLRTPLYQPNQPAPTNFVELGDCANGLNPASTWVADDRGRVKLYTRYSIRGF